MSHSRINVRKMVLAGIFAAMTAICAWISIPVMEIAFTMQTFAVLLTLGVLGGRWGTVSILIYLLLGAVGLPVFSGFRGGPGVLLGVTGGYLLGFLASGFVYWLVTAVFGEKSWARLVGMVLGLLSCYGFGSGWFLALYAGEGNVMTFGAVVLTCVVPYLIPDACKLTLACLLTTRLKRQLKQI